MIKPAALTETLLKDIDSLFRCPTCRDNTLRIPDEQDCVECSNCGVLFPIDLETGLCSFLAAASDSAAKEDIRKWWGDLWRQRYADHEELDSYELEDLIKALEDLFAKRWLLPSVEMSGVV